MCGFLFSNKNQNKEEFISRLEEIKYRGPDFTGYHCEDGLHFGHLRLSILDLDPRSNQPFIYQDLILLFNGEIYNFGSIREDLIKLGYQFNTESDTEVLIKGYHAWGKDVLHHLNGMFAFLIYNTKSKTIFGARDRLGVKPLYYSVVGDTFEVCSQLTPMQKGNAYNIDMDAISIYLDCKFIPSPYSIYKEVKKLEAGCYFEYSFESSTFSAHKYWDLQNVVPFEGSYSQAKENLKGLLFDAVNIRLFADVPLGLFLSSGVDSALITSVASKLSPSTLNTFTVSFSESPQDESEMAKKYAEILKTNHKTIPCGPEEILNYLPDLINVYDEPFGDNSALPTILLNKHTKEFVTVALSGDGGDESFLGYYHFESLQRNKIIINLPYGIRYCIFKTLNAVKKINGRIKDALLVRHKYQYILRIYSRMGILLKTPFNRWYSHYSYLKDLSSSFIQQAADVNIKLWLEGDSNVKVDRGSMAASVEVRSPFLDYRLVEFARSLPVEFRLQNGNKKRILKDLLTEFIPFELFNLPKRGFAMPLKEWIKNELRNEIENSLNEAFFSAVPNLNEKLVRQMLNEHINGNMDHSESIWKVFILAKWFEKNVFNNVQ